MGIKIESPKSSESLPYSGFRRLREVVATLMGEDVGLHYAELRSAPWFEKDRERWFEEYNKETRRLLAEHPSKAKAIMFLYEPDDKTLVDLATVRDVYAVVEKADLDESFGYPGDPVTLADFKRLLMECAEAGKPLKWE